MKTIPGVSLQVQNIFCIGRNYAEHAKELGNAIPTEPIIFMKPTSAICYSGDVIALPKQSARVDHEVEIVVAIGRKGKFISAAEALSHIAGIGIGIDRLMMLLTGQRSIRDVMLFPLQRQHG